MRDAGGGIERDVERLEEVGEVGIRVSLSAKVVSESAGGREGRTRVESSQSRTPMTSGLVGWKICSSLR